MIQDIELYTADSRLVETVQDPIVGMMCADGKPPEVLIWGERVFVLAPPDAYQSGAIRYREGMAWVLRLGQEATPMPSPRVDGALAGKTLLPAGSSVPDPRPETTDSDIPGAEKMTESYKPPEDETAGQHLARLGTDAQTWTSDFAYRFPGSIAGINMGRRAGYETMLGWFAGAIEAGRTTGYSQGRTAALDETPEAVDKILEEAPDSWDGEESGDWIAVQFVKEMCRRLDAAGLSREKYPDEVTPPHSRDEAAAGMVFEALGEASMCWSERPVGVFDSERAGDVGRRLLLKLGFRVPKAYRDDRETK